MSDTHNFRPDNIPDGDVVIHCGDATNMGSLKEILAFMQWFKELPHPIKIYVPGNHDILIERELSLWRSEFKANGINMLVNEEMIVGGLRLFGMPYVNRYFDWAFMLNPMDMQRQCNNIPDDVEVLITHGPPYSILDYNERGDHLGSRELYGRVKELQDLKYCFFGHIHPGYGREIIHLDDHSIEFINCACFPDKDPVVLDVQEVSDEPKE